MDEGIGPMTKRENLLGLYRREGCDEVPVGMHLCPALVEEFKRRHPDEASYLEYFGAPYRIIYDPGFPWNFDAKWRVPNREHIDWMQYYSEDEFQREKRFDLWGTAHEKGSEEAKHMTQMHHPLKDVDSLEAMQAYPWPDFSTVDFSYLHDEVKAVQDQGLAVFVWAECTIWETAWYLRGMDNLMMDMAMADEKATWMLDTITEKACQRARAFARAGADILGLGDDVGMQDALMMSRDMYRAWMKPRLARVIAAAKEVKPDILISYHSCGHVTPLIGDFIEAGVDILNPVQPECMDFEAVFEEYGGRISFNGTIGTQQLMPHGTPEEVKVEVHRNLKIAGEKGGLFCCPTHMLEPEVPWENIEAYVQACRDFAV
jgi:uroporphyrinogen decarboxylase